MGSVLPYTLGTVLSFRFSRAGQDFTALPVTIILDLRDGGNRIILRYLNGGTDGTLEGGGGAVLFTKTPAWGITNLVPGLWQITVYTGTAETTQAEAGTATLSVDEPFNGPPPVVGA